jgi:uncharacterized membrane protein YdbT with pleckstrin-like domain
MGSYIQKILGVNEYIIGITRLHWIIFVGPIMVIVFGLFIFTVSFFVPINFPFLINILPIIIGIGFYGIVWLIMNTTEFVSTNKRVLVKKGIISRHITEIYLNKIEGALVTQSIMGRLFNYGILQIRGTGGSIIEYALIYDPFVFQKTINWK